MRSNWLTNYGSALVGGPANIKQVAGDVLRLSNDYNSCQPVSNIWANARSAQAYLHYFFALNWLRCLAVIQEAQRTGFFDGFDSLLEIGSGPGTFHFAALEAGVQFAQSTFVDSAEAQSIHSQLLAKISQQTAFANSLSKNYWATKMPRPERHTLVVMSYSLNELMAWPNDVESAGGFLIIEPSSRKTSRNLQSLRGELISRGFHPWAPCTHQKSCPLLVGSDKDWCHFRIQAERPDWLQLIESEIGIRNDTLTYSYLLMKREQPSARLREGRIIGDTLYERGKVRQAVCRGEDREFLSWLTRDGEPSPIPNGSIVELPAEIVKKGNEIRLSAATPLKIHS